MLLSSHHVVDENGHKFFATLSTKRWSLFLHPLNLGWPFDLLWPEHSRGDVSRDLAAPTLVLLGFWPETTMLRRSPGYESRWKERPISFQHSSHRTRGPRHTSEAILLHQAQDAAARMGPGETNIRTALSTHRMIKKINCSCFKLLNFEGFIMQQ